MKTVPTPQWIADFLCRNRAREDSWEPVGAEFAKAIGFRLELSMKRIVK